MTDKFMFDDYAQFLDMAMGHQAVWGGVLRDFCRLKKKNLACLYDCISLPYPTHRHAQITKRHYKWRTFYSEVCFSALHKYFWPHSHYMALNMINCPFYPPRWTPCFSVWPHPSMRAARPASFCQFSSVKTVAASCCFPPTWPSWSPDPLTLPHRHRESQHLRSWVKKNI